MANIWTKDNEYEDVTNIEQALISIKQPGAKAPKKGKNMCVYTIK